MCINVQTNKATHFLLLTKLISRVHCFSKFSLCRYLLSCHLPIFLQDCPYCVNISFIHSTFWWASKPRSQFCRQTSSFGRVILNLPCMCFAYEKEGCSVQSLSKTGSSGKLTLRYPQSGETHSHMQKFC